MVLNPVTDQLRLVQEMQNQGSRIETIFGRIPIPVSGYFQEVYRNGIPVGTVLPQERCSSDQLRQGQLRLYRGDVIYLIPATPVPYSFQGALVTKERYQRIYDVQIELDVQNARCLIGGYRKGRDPARWVVYYYKQYFEAYASQYEYNRIEEIRTSLALKAEQLSMAYGIKILNPQWNLKDDPKRLQADEEYLETDQRKRGLGNETTVQEYALQLDHRKTMTHMHLQLDTLEMKRRLRSKEIEVESELKKLEDHLKRESERLQEEFKREEKRKNNEFAREEQMRKAQHEARMKLLNHTLEVLVASNAERIRDVLEYNGSARAILEESLKLFGVFEDSPQDVQEIIEAVLSQEDQLPQTEEIEGISKKNVPSSEETWNKPEI